MEENKLNVNNAEESKQLTDEEIEKIIKEKYISKDYKTRRFIFKAIKKFGNKFDYKKTIISDSHTKAMITCPIHGDFEIRTDAFLNSRFGCAKCSYDSMKSNMEEFKKRAKELFPQYEVVDGQEYVNNRTKIKMYCTIHNRIFEITPGNLLYKKVGCKECNKENRLLSRQKTEEEDFIEFFKNSFDNNKYELLFDENGSIGYVNYKTPLKIKSKQYNTIFEQTPETIQRHFRENSELFKTDREELNRIKREQNFINKCRKLFGNKYDYSLVYYIDTVTSVKIKCNKCGRIFEIIPHNFLRTNYEHCSCYSRDNITVEEFVPKVSNCGGVGSCFSNKNITLRYSLFVQFLNKYFPEYTLLTNVNDFINDSSKIKIKCNKCGTVIETTPRGVKRKISEHHNVLEICPKCRVEVIRRSKEAEFIKGVKNKFGEDAFDLSNVCFVNIDTKVKITCNKCGREFEITPYHLLNGVGCKYCSISSGETCIKDWLTNNNLQYSMHVKIESTIISGKTGHGVEIDFCLEYNNINFWIEYNGEQHYRWCKYFQDTKEEFDNQVKRDEEVRNYCLNNKIVLIEIPWTYGVGKKVNKILEDIIINGKPISIINQPKISYNRKGGSKDGQ